MVEKGERGRGEVSRNWEDECWEWDECFEVDLVECMNRAYLVRFGFCIFDELCLCRLLFL